MLNFERENPKRYVCYEPLVGGLPKQFKRMGKAPKQKRGVIALLKMGEKSAKKMGRNTLEQCFGTSLLDCQRVVCLSFSEIVRADVVGMYSLLQDDGECYSIITKI